MNPLIEHNLARIQSVCRAYGIERLEVFGSATTGAFSAASDVDFIATFPDDFNFGPWLSRFQDLQHDLATIVGRRVDLVMSTAIRDPYFRREASKTRTVIYDAAENAEVA